MINVAMILAAGRGERLRPLTDSQPKPLCTVQNTPLIEYHIQKLALAGFERLVINHAYLGGKIRKQLGFGQRFGIDICYSPEPPGALETGGGIVNALGLLGDQPFVTINADIFTDYDFSLLRQPKRSPAHLILIKKPAYFQHGDFGLSEKNQLQNTDKQYTFTGIAAYHPSLFNRCKPGRFSITPLLRQLAETHEATGDIYDGQWCDIGSLERLQWANQLASDTP